MKTLLPVDHYRVCSDVEPLIAGVDEAGRGPLAGPVAIAAVILDPDRPIPGLADSKALTALARDRLFDQIQARASGWRIELISADQIDAMNILRATLEGMRQALTALRPTPVLALIDGNQMPPDLPCAARVLIRGDSLEPAISAASILAKTARDRYMVELDRRYPDYGFAQHKGYPTKDHREALRRLGPCPEHRRSFAPVKAFLDAG